MDDLTIFFKHVDFFNRLDGLNIQLLQGALQFLVIRTGALVCLFDFSTWGSFSADSDDSSLSLKPCEPSLVHDSPELDIVRESSLMRRYFDRCELEMMRCAWKGRAQGVKFGKGEEPGPLLCALRDCQFRLQLIWQITCINRVPPIAHME